MSSEKTARGRDVIGNVSTVQEERGSIYYRERGLIQEGRNDALPTAAAFPSFRRPRRMREAPRQRRRATPS